MNETANTINTTNTTKTAICSCCGGHSDTYNACYHCRNTSQCGCKDCIGDYDCLTCEDNGYISEFIEKEMVEFPGDSRYQENKIECPDCGPRARTRGHEFVGLEKIADEHWAIICSCGKTWEGYRFMVEEFFNEHSGGGLGRVTG